jgi:hypothetical protein
MDSLCHLEVTLEALCSTSSQTKSSIKNSQIVFYVTISFLDFEKQMCMKCLSVNYFICQVHEELLQLPDWSSRLNHALLELPHKMQNREKHLRIALTAVADHISSVLQYQHSGALLSGEVTLVRPADESEDNCGLTKVTFSFVYVL